MSKKYKVGQTIPAAYLGRGQFSLLTKSAEQPDKSKQRKRGDLVTARYVKHIKGRGVTV
jgi:hypothetical protein